METGPGIGSWSAMVGVLSCVSRGPSEESKLERLHDIYRGRIARSINRPTATWATLHLSLRNKSESARWWSRLPQ